jgi:hypothetical protein
MPQTQPNDIISHTSEDDSAHRLAYGPQPPSWPQAQQGIGSTVELSFSSDSDDEMDNMWLSLDCSDSDIDLECPERLRSGRLGRATDAYVYSGNLLACALNKNGDESLNWRYLPEHEQERRWIQEVRMPEHVFRELLKLVEPFVRPSIPRNPSQRIYTAKDKLLVTLAWMAHCETLRSLGSKMGLPHASISLLCLRLGVQALRQLFLENPPTRNIKRPRDEAAQATVMQGFRDRCKVPGCLCAINGCLIPIKSLDGSRQTKIQTRIMVAKVEMRHCC